MVIMETAQGLSLPLWRAARRLHVGGVCLVVLAGVYGVAGFVAAAWLVINWQDSSRWPVAAGMLLGTATVAGVFFVAGFAAQAGARAILERDLDATPGDVDS